MAPQGQSHEAGLETQLYAGCILTECTCPARPGATGEAQIKKSELESAPGLTAHNRQDDGKSLCLFLHLENGCDKIRVRFK